MQKMAEFLRNCPKNIYCRRRGAHCASAVGCPDCQLADYGGAKGNVGVTQITINIYLNCTGAHLRTYPFAVKSRTILLLGAEKRVNFTPAEVSIFLEATVCGESAYLS